MKRLRLIALLSIVLFTFSTHKSSQAQESRYWYFGEEAGIDFGTSTPSAISNGSIMTGEGTAVHSDANGNLMFYTDGKDIYNSLHQLVNTGASQKLFGHESSTHSALIVPKPNSNNRFFIFTADAQALNWNPIKHGVNYTEIEVNGTSISIISLNNNLIPHNQATERLAATCAENGSFWVVAMLRNGDFLSYNVNSFGVSGAQLSSGSASPWSGNTDDLVGQMKISPSGDKLAITRRQNGAQSEVFNFNNGNVGSSLGVYFTGVGYGLEFSTNGEYLYYTDDFWDVYRYNIGAASTSLVFNNPSGQMSQQVGALQLGLDGNIYVSNGGEFISGTNVDRITNIDGSTPIYNNDHFSYTGTTVTHLGLPSFISCYNAIDCNVTAGFELAMSETPCSVLFSNTSITYGGDVVGYHIDFGDGNTYDGLDFQSLTHTYDNRGGKLGFNACLTVYVWNGQECCTDTYCEFINMDICDPGDCSIVNDIEVEPAECGPDCTFDFEGILVQANREITGWHWDFDDGTTATGQNVTHTFPQNGNYTVCLTTLAADPNGIDACCYGQTCNVYEVNCDDGTIVELQGLPTGPSDEGGDLGTGLNGFDADGLEVSGDEIIAYPNPAQNEVNISVPSEKDANYRITLTSYTGAQIDAPYTINVNGNRSVINVQTSELPSGIYLIELESATNSWSDKVILMD